MTAACGGVGRQASPKGHSPPHVRWTGSGPQKRSGSVVVVVLDDGTHAARQLAKSRAHLEAPAIVVAAQPWRHARRSAAVWHPATHARASATTPRAHSDSATPHGPTQSPAGEGTGGVHASRQLRRSVPHSTLVARKVTRQPSMQAVTPGA